MFTDIYIHIYRPETWTACLSQRAKHAVDLDLAVARTGPHEVGAGR